MTILLSRALDRWELDPSNLFPEPALLLRRDGYKDKMAAFAARRTRAKGKAPPRALHWSSSPTPPAGPVLGVVGAKAIGRRGGAIAALPVSRLGPLGENDPSVAARRAIKYHSVGTPVANFGGTAVHQRLRPNIPARIGLNPNRRDRSCKLARCYDAPRRLRRERGPAGRAIEPRALRRGTRGPLRV